MELKRNARRGTQISDILSAILLCLAAVLAGAHETPSSVSAASQGAVGASVADQPSIPVLNKRSLVFVSSASAKSTFLSSAGGTDLALAPSETSLPDYAAGNLSASSSARIPTDGAKHSYDARGPPALI